MRLIICEQQDLEEPEVTIAYREMTSSVKRVSDFVCAVNQTVLCKKNDEKTIIVGQLSQKSKTLAFKIGVVCFCVFLILFLLNLEKYSHLLRYMTIFDIIIYIIKKGVV